MKNALQNIPCRVGSQLHAYSRMHLLTCIGSRRSRTRRFIFICCVEKNRNVCIQIIHIINFKCILHKSLDLLGQYMPWFSILFFLCGPTSYISSLAPHLSSLSSSCLFFFPDPSGPGSYYDGFCVSIALGRCEKAHLS